MANLHVTIRISTPLPVSARDLPKLEKLAVEAGKGHKVKPSKLGTVTEGGDLVIYYEMTVR